MLLGQILSLVGAAYSKVSFGPTTPKRITIIHDHIPTTKDHYNLYSDYRTLGLHSAAAAAAAARAGAGEKVCRQL